jgi:hypothetical protein
METITNKNREAFEVAEAYYTNMGFEVVNPHTIGEALRLINQEENLPEPHYLDYLTYDLAHLVECDEMHLLPNYKGSFGCSIEIAYAEKKGIPIYHAFTQNRAELKVHFAVVTAYDSLVNSGRITETIESMQP